MDKEMINAEFIRIAIANKTGAATPKAAPAAVSEPSGEVISANYECAVVKWSKQPDGDPENAWSWPVAGTKVYLAAPAEPEMIYHFEKRSSFGPWIEVEQPTDKSVAFVKAFPTEQDGRTPGMEAEAVETLTSEGWVWDGDQWVKPAAQSADAVAFAQWLSSDNGVAVMMTPAGREEIRNRAAALSQSAEADKGE